jgi:acetyltransferase-like isoleucine patch superfamily enzyme
MKSIFKKILLFLAKYFSYIDNMFFKWQIFTRVDLGLLLRNFIHQRIFRINSSLPFPIHFTSRVIGFNKIKLNLDRNTVGSFCLSPHCYIQALGGIEIGKNFLFAPGIRLISVNHGVNNEFKKLDSKPIIIGKNVWLGANVIILPEVNLGNNVVVGAGAVVTKSFPDNVIIAGNPARVIKEIVNN